MIIEQPSFERIKGPIKLPKTEKKVQPVEKVNETKEVDDEQYREKVEKEMGKGNQLDEQA